MESSTPRDQMSGSDLLLYHTLKYCQPGAAWTASAGWAHRRMTIAVAAHHARKPRRVGRARQNVVCRGDRRGGQIRVWPLGADAGQLVQGALTAPAVGNHTAPPDSGLPYCSRVPGRPWSRRRGDPGLKRPPHEVLTTTLKKVTIESAGSRVRVLQPQEHSLIDPSDQYVGMGSYVEQVRGT